MISCCLISGFRVGWVMIWVSFVSRCLICGFSSRGVNLAGLNGLSGRGVDLAGLNGLAFLDDGGWVGDDGCWVGDDGCSLGVE